jgi:hypothetical protein
MNSQDYKFYIEIYVGIGLLDYALSCFSSFKNYAISEIFFNFNVLIKLTSTLKSIKSIFVKNFSLFFGTYLKKAISRQ